MKTQTGRLVKTALMQTMGLPTYILYERIWARVCWGRAHE